MRGRLATTTGYRSPPLPEGERLKPFPLWGELKEGTCPKGASEGPGRESYLFSRREKIEMRGRLATTTGYRSPPPSRSVTHGLKHGWGPGVLPLLPTGED